MDKENLEETNQKNEEFVANESNVAAEEKKAPSTASISGQSELLTQNQDKKSKFKLDKGIITLLVLFAIILIGYGGYNLIQKYSRNTVDFNGISYTTPKVQGTKRNHSRQEGSFYSEDLEQDLTIDDKKINIKICCEPAGPMFTEREIETGLIFLNNTYAPVGFTCDNPDITFDASGDVWEKMIVGTPYNSDVYVWYFYVYDKNDNKARLMSLEAPKSLYKEAVKIMDSVQYKPESK